MNNNELKLGVALTKELCPICCKEMNGPIIMNKRLSKPQKEKVESMNNKVIGFADHCCDECAKYKDEAVFIVAVDAEKSDFHDISKIYRAGKYCAIKKDTEFIKQEEIQKCIIKLKDDTQFCFMDIADYEGFKFDEFVQKNN